MNITVKGKLISNKKYFNPNGAILEEEGEIELPDLRGKVFTEGDIVWCEYPLIRNKYNQIIPNTTSAYVKYIAHFPSPAPQVVDMPEKLTYMRDTEEIVNTLNALIDIVARMRDEHEKT